MPENKQLDFPENPENIPAPIRNGEDLVFEDLVREIDRLRRIIEFNEGSPQQEDASASGRIVVPSGTKASVVVEPEDNHNFYLKEAGLNPNDANLDFEIKADDISTEANSLFFANPFTVRRKVELEADNPTASDRLLTFFTNARQVKVR